MPDIQFCLLQGLCTEQSSLFSPFASPSTQAAAQAQDYISWTNLLLGQLNTEWSDLQPTICLASPLLPYLYIWGYGSVEKKRIRLAVTPSTIAIN